MNSGYILGPRGFEKNNYLDSIIPILDNFNLQLEKLNQINKQKDVLMSEYAGNNNDVSEEQLREWYNEDNISMPFEKYKEEILKERQKKQPQLDQLLQRNKYEYNANVRYMQDIIYETSQNIQLERKQIQRKLDEFNIQLNQLRLDREKIGIQYDAERRIINEGMLKEFRQKEDSLIFEIQKLQQALKKLDDMHNLMKESLEKYSLGLRTLNPIEREFYEEIKKANDQDYTTNYKKELDEYNKLLEMYEEDYERFIDLNNKLLNDEISYEEYKKYADYMLERYDSLKEQYNKVNELYEKTKEEVANNQKWHPSLTEEQIEDLKRRGIRKPTGYEYEKYLNTMGLDKDRIPVPIGPTQVSGLGEKKKDDVLKIDKKEHKPKLTWKTAAAVAAGIGIGATVFFTAGPLGVTVMNIAAAITKVVVSKKLAKARAKRLSGIKEVEKIEIPDSKLKAAIFKLKQYLKSEEGLRDMSWLLTSAILTGTSLSIIDGISNAIEASKAQPTQTIEPSPESISQAQVEPTPKPITQVEPTTEIGIGDSIDGMNITEGYDTANWAINNNNAESLLTQYGEGATIKEFVTSSGEHFTSGSLQDVMSQTGLGADDIAARLITSNGGEYAWVGADQLGAVAETVGKVL